MDEKEARRLVARLNLRPHPEGGFFGETFRSSIEIGKPWSRPAMTSIYYLLSDRDFSGFHRLKSDEIWHHYRGAAVTIEIIERNGSHRRIVIGERACWQAAVAAGSWFAAHARGPGGYALVGCDVAPGFTYEDFELATRDALKRAFPQHRRLIERWTRE
ncbi:MAG: cupin domain-containing protein [Candidatus Eremiobacteraeota bacterium]|nr:cupin domain-containing protein [Candidatus Eremiobacteraeota bacterium]